MRASELKEQVEFMDKYINENSTNKEVIIAWYVIKQALDEKLYHYEKERKRMIEYRLKQKWTLCI